VPFLEDEVLTGVVELEAFLAEGPPAVDPDDELQGFLSETVAVVLGFLCVTFGGSC
jgi:hypothetical protein